MAYMNCDPMVPLTVFSWTNDSCYVRINTTELKYEKKKSTFASNTSNSISTDIQLSVQVKGKIEWSNVNWNRRIFTKQSNLTLIFVFTF